MGKRLKVKVSPGPEGEYKEIVYAFKDVKVECSLNPAVYGPDDREKALGILKQISKEVWIDKTYVDFKGTRFEKTFLTEAGWNALRELVEDTGYGRRCSPEQKKLLDDTFRAMLPGYFEMMFDDIGWNSDDMAFEIPEGTEFTVEYYPDTAEEWRRYPGRWQTWDA